VSYYETDDFIEHFHEYNTCTLKFKRIVSADLLKLLYYYVLIKVGLKNGLQEFEI